MSELGDEAEDTKGAIENIFDDIQEKTVSNEDDERNESILTTPGRERSWERLNKMSRSTRFLRDADLCE